MRHFSSGNGLVLMAFFWLRMSSAHKNVGRKTNAAVETRNAAPTHEAAQSPDLTEIAKQEESPNLPAVARYASGDAPSAPETSLPDSASDMPRAQPGPPPEAVPLAAPKTDFADAAVANTPVAAPEPSAEPSSEVAPDQVALAEDDARQTSSPPAAPPSDDSRTAMPDAEAIEGRRTDPRDLQERTRG